MSLRLVPVPVPDTPVEPVVGRAFRAMDGSRRVEYQTASGDKYVCVTDGATRQWYAVVHTPTTEE